jgi:hypothetical protein
LHAADDPPVSELANWLKERELMTDVIRQHLNRAKQRMKKQADTKRSKRTFQLDDWVFLKLQPYVQSSVADRAHQKLAFKFFGPFRIVERIGSVAYRLELPASSSIHPIFHVSQLKKSVGAHQSVSDSLPPSTIRWSIPVKIIQQRTIMKGSTQVRQGLVQWSNLPASLSTWEDLEFLCQRFPRAAVWGHPRAHGGGDVSATASAAPVDDAVLDPLLRATCRTLMKKDRSEPRLRARKCLGRIGSVADAHPCKRVCVSSVLYRLASSC